MKVLVFGCAILHTVLCWLVCCHGDSYEQYYMYNQVCLMLAPENDNGTECYDYGAANPEPYFQNNIIGHGIVATPRNACSTVQPQNAYITPDQGGILLIADDKECSYKYKVLMAKNGGYIAAIVYSESSDSLITMDVKQSGRQTEIFAFYVGKTAGEKLRQYDYKTRGVIIITPRRFNFLNLWYYVIPFVIIVGICFVLMAMFMISRYYRHYLERRRNRLSSTNLRKIPTKKFKKGDEYYDVCAICLDEYKEGDRLRILPCDHAYHCKCVDPWLTEGKRTCPVCKRPVEAGKKKQNGRGRDAEGGQHVGEDEPDENTPLIQPALAPSAPSASNAVPA